MNQQLEKDKAELKRLQRELSWKQDEVNRIERAIEYGRCKQCNVPLSDGDKEFCGDYPKCHSELTSLDDRVEAFGEALKNLTPEQMEKYFPEDKTPKGWVSIEDHLPAVTCGDFLEHGAIVRFVKVKDNDGNESESQVGDARMWYYIVKEHGITHWWNN